jgi:hypothetical protein
VFEQPLNNLLSSLTGLVMVWRADASQDARDDSPVKCPINPVTVVDGDGRIGVRVWVPSRSILLHTQPLLVSPLRPGQSAERQWRAKDQGQCGGIIRTGPDQPKAAPERADDQRQRTQIDHNSPTHVANLSSALPISDNLASI